MIPFDFEYHRPNTLDDAIQLLEDHKAAVFCGGTEFTTFARNNHLHLDAIIDIKGLPECQEFKDEGGQIILGAALTLNEIIEAGRFPLLGETVRRVADHSSRNKITIGGHLNSRLIYREGMLPLLLSDTKLKVAGINGERIIQLDHSNQLQLNPGEVLIQIMIDKKYASLPFVHYKKTRFSKVGYPLLTIAAIQKEDKMAFAFSGISSNPFRSEDMESVLNDDSLSPPERVEKAIELLPAPIIDDFQGSAGYRKFILSNGLLQIIKDFEEAN
ncbi:MAG TPA: xanthine dehydrogenase [Bacillus bacterium]|uniref:FAD binding domain-containing protein n=1 Tax=Siminovitchia fordii TaxID=254759 RepID=UPI0003659294|nr:FAD binding domain-containing protein [Siminovitchia fordii]HBZ09543.1 xanthine dehydrogenase [Bacillus sp. (in: firmicutes)]